MTLISKSMAILKQITTHIYALSIFDMAVEFIEFC